ncbi:MAG: chorismate pyruvate-lyase family protein [Actinomycetota bacterium]|nr:chorismate pyruvate-lyase family protein [Actinomycetota bacterium]
MNLTTPLTRFQRILLGTDGTVTHILEAYADEPIEVVKLFQAFDVSVDGDAALLLSEGERVLRRRVLLRGTRSNRNLLYAEVVVVLGRVDRGILDGLVATDKPIGILLRENRAETFREILGIEREPAGSCASHFGIDPDAEIIGRTYRIVARRQPVILVTEKFPSGFFRDLPA